MGYIKTYSGVNAMSKLMADVKKDITKACINTVNIQAAVTRKKAIENLQQKLILRNTFTTRAVAFDPCPRSAKRLSDIKSTVGARERAGYLKRQEEGGIRKPEQGTNLAIPTDAARTTSSKQKRVMAKYNFRKNPKVRGPFKRRGLSSKARHVARAYVAAREKKLIRSRKGLFKVTDFKKIDKKIEFKPKLIYNTEHTVTRTPKTPWLMPAAEKTARMGQTIYNNEMKKL